MIDTVTNGWRRWWPLLPLRLVVGYGFLAHGIAKWSTGPQNFGKFLHLIGAPAPVLTAWLVMLVEIVGGIAIAAGILVEIVSVPLIISMLVALFTVHIHYGFSSVHTIGLTATAPVFGPPGYEINLLYIAALVAIAVTGAGPLSVEAVLRGRSDRNVRSQWTR